MALPALPALPALRVRGPYFGLTTLVAVLMLQNFALPHANRVYVLEHARIVWEGGPAKFAAEMGTGYL